MVSFYVYVIFLMVNVNSIISILVKGSPPLYSKISLLPSNLDTPLTQKKESTHIKNRVLINPEKIRQNATAILTFLSTNKYDVDHTLKDVIYHAPTYYKSYLIDDIKPIHEDENAPDTVSSANTYNPSGYHYNPPASGNVQIFNEELHQTKNTDTTQKILKAIGTLDRYLKPYLNNGNYNSALHLPTNPVLSLILSRYGRYIPGHGNSGIYSYMAVNNINNNKPFGQYKYERDEDYTYN